VLLDLKALEFISSAGLRSLLTVAKAIQKEGRTLAFINLAPMVADVFKMAGFLSILKVYPDKVSAAKELGA
jgi:anti-anti-sigma factor